MIGNDEMPVNLNFWLQLVVELKHSKEIGV